MITVRRWSGREVRALREAKRMSVRDFAAHLGVSDRMVSKWEAADEWITPRPVNQEALDTSLSMSGEDVQMRFAEVLRLSRAQDTPGKSPGLTPLRRAREARGRSQQQVIVAMEAYARRNGLEIAQRSSLKTMLSGWENGRRSSDLSEKYREIFRQIYQASDEELGFPSSSALDYFEYGDHALAEPLAFNPDFFHAHQDDTSSDSEVHDGQGNLPSLITIGAGDLARSSLEDASEEHARTLLMANELADSEGEAMLRREFLETSMALSLSMRSPVFAPPSPSGRIGHEAVGILRQRTLRMRRLDDLLGGADTFRLYADELARTIRIIRDNTYDAELGNALLSIAAEQAQQAGWAAFDSGLHKLSEKLYRASMRFAEHGNDKALIGNSLSLLSYQRIDNKQSGVAEATASYEWAKDSSRAVRALMLERKAFAYANAGDDYQTERALEEAHELITHGENGSEPSWVQWADEREFRLISGRCWSDLHRPLRAVPILEAVLAEFDDSEARNKSVYLTWLASSYIDGGEIEQATTVLRRALDLSFGVASIRPRNRVVRQAQRLARHRSLETVANLLDHIKETSTGLPLSL